EVERELTAQIERLHHAGVELTHLDAHKHVHAYPPVFAVVARLAVRFGIPAVRVPYERWSRTSLLAGNPRVRRTARRQAFLNAAMWTWAWRDYRTAASSELRTPTFIGRIHTGVLNSSTLQATLRATSDGVTELMVHPGYVDDELVKTGTRLLGSRETELSLLCSMETRALLDDERIVLVRHDLGHTSRRSLSHVS